MTSVIECILSSFINISIDIISDKKKPLIIRILFPIIVFGIMLVATVGLIISSVIRGDTVIIVILIIIFTLMYVNIILRIKAVIAKRNLNRQ